MLSINQDSWSFEQPDSLQGIATAICVRHIQCLAKSCNPGNFELRDGLALPSSICENLLTYNQAHTFHDTNSFLRLFSDTSSTKLNKLLVRNSNISIKTLENLLAHGIQELDISGCELLTHSCTSALCIHGNLLRVLRLGNTAHTVLLPGLRCPHLRVLSAHQLDLSEKSDMNQTVTSLIKSATQLTCLDLSFSQLPDNWPSALKDHLQLTSLCLHGVFSRNICEPLRSIMNIPSLRHLDLSQSPSEELFVPYNEQGVSVHMIGLLNNLPHLQSLDVSWTNLLSSIAKHPLDDVTSADLQTALARKQLKYLGLLGCSDHLCQMDNIPAEQVTGDATEAQVLLSIEVYHDRIGLLRKALTNVFAIFRHQGCEDPRRALMAILKAMRLYPSDKETQICGSREGKGLKHSLKQRIINALLDAMEEHMQTTMLRNGCLTLCHFQIPQDVMYQFRRLVQLLLQLIDPEFGTDEYVQRISIYLLNSLACQIDGSEKKLVGELGAIDILFAVIHHKLLNKTCDEVLEIAWSGLWNLTDETADNCDRFVRKSGLRLFYKCYKAFPTQEELLRNMMGLMGNVAEVTSLRPCLLVSWLVEVFMRLLMSDCDGIEVSYNACGVLAHLVSDGDWSIDEPPLHAVAGAMHERISQWNLKTKRNINYRSFEPILRLLQCHKAPQAQHWAAWALCNLTKMYKHKYCELVMKEKGIEMLQAVIADPRPYDEIKDLAKQVVLRCSTFAAGGHVGDTDEEEEEETENM